MPLLVPITGFLSLEGSSQRDGALLALRELDLPKRVDLQWAVQDTGTEPGRAVNALLRALDPAEGRVIAAVASIFGPQMLAMMPVAAENDVPLLTISGTARITEMDNPWVFRFFPSDATVKRAQMRYAVDTLGAERPAILYQTTAYGQSGRDHLVGALAERGITPVHEEGLAPSVKDLLPSIAKAMAAEPDVLLLQLHAGPSALFVRQYAATDHAVPIVGGSALHQPSTAALLDPSELAGVCAETGSSPISGGSPAMRAFTDAFRQAFDRPPDAFALAQYDGVNMAKQAIREGARTPQEMRQALATMHHEGVAMTYDSDGQGNMAHDAVIVCYDGESRVPAIAARYEDLRPAPKN
jgi:branched-chain amino acid transport system substrate-binding protein